MLVFGLLKKITIHEVNPRRKFIYGPGIDEPVCMINVDTAGNEQLYFYHYDGLGSVIALSDVNGNIVEQYTYTPFGTPTISTTLKPFKPLEPHSSLLTHHLKVDYIDERYSRSTYTIAT